MARVLAHPLRLAGTELAKVDDGSDAGLAQLVAVLCTTRRGEREMVPAFGLEDPAFRGITAAEVNAGLAMFGPAVEVDAVDAEVVDDLTERVRLSFRPLEE